MAFSEDEGVWDEFLARWPIERLRTMTLREYTQAGDKTTFTYWIESGLDRYGSIWGGSAFKFGIYSRNETAPKSGDGSLAYDDRYGWYRRFGATSEAAFATVRREVVAIAEAARSGGLATIDGSELGPSYRWKIAFHYQDRDQPRLIPCVFQREPLLHACGLDSEDRRLPLSTLYSRVAELRESGQSVIAFSRDVWRNWVLSTPLDVRLTEGAVRNAYIPVNLVSSPFPESIRGGADEREAGEPARFVTDTGWTFESDVRALGSDSGRLRTRFTAYFKEQNVQPGDVIRIQPDEDGVFHITHLPKGAAMTAPSTLQRPAEVPDPVVRESTSKSHRTPTNRIFFGPPGTGKTYRTVDEALRLLDPEFLERHSRDRHLLKSRFDGLVKAGVIHSVTFHQSFSYEDFVEGIRAIPDETGSGMCYDVEDGVFKQVCMAARSRSVAPAPAAVDVEGRRIWKISLGDANTEGHIFEECMRSGVALLGFGSNADLAGVTSRMQIVDRLRAAGENVESEDYPVTALDLLVRRVKTGDIVVVTQGNLRFRAIGEVTGEYVHVDREGVDTYAQGRPVRWLRRYEPARPYSDLMENRFSQMSIYELRPGSISLERLKALLASEGPDLPGRQDRVLIIDEINRGNVSRIFGELITLIEPTKREGAAEALEVLLPYSKERFSVPDSLHIIGTMNTADRSLAGLDVALRRRFEFVEMLPDLDALRSVLVDRVPVDDLLEVMNQRIEVLLGRDYMIGHANFMPLRERPTLDALAGIFRRQVIPLLQEYFFEDWQKISWVLNDHRKTDPCTRFLLRSEVSMRRLFGDGLDLPPEGRSWTINESAFDRVDSYLSVIEAPQADP